MSLDRFIDGAYISVSVMTERERVEAVLHGRVPDRPPVSCWYHFGHDCSTGSTAVDAHLRHLEAYGLDFLKVMNDHPYPRGEVAVVRTVGDLRRIRPLAGDAERLADQLEVLRRLKERLAGDVLMCATLFNAWTVLRAWTRPPSDVHAPPRIDGQDDRDALLTALLREDRAAVKAAVAAIGETLGAFARGCVDAGADGVFLSVRDDWVDTPANGQGTYRELVRPVDLAILAAVRGAPFSVLHVCGRPRDFLGFSEYPVAVLNWSDRATGPSIAWARDRIRPAIAAGVDNLRTLPEGTPQECAAEVRDALRQAGERPIIVAPGCTYDPVRVPVENVRAMFQAARSGAG